MPNDRKAELPRRSLPHIRWRLSSFCLFAFACLGCSTQNNAAHRFAWDDSRARLLEQKWQGLPVAAQDPKSAAGERWRALIDLLKKELSAQDMRDFALSCESMPVSPNDRSDFTNRLLAAVALLAAESDDRDCLVSLLSRRCPARIGWADVESVVAATPRKTPDPILILRDAYEKSDVPEVRHEIASAVRRAFFGSGIKYSPGARSEQDDRSFVLAAMEWYMANKARLAINPQYGSNKIGHSYEDHPLFVLKP